MYHIGMKSAEQLLALINDTNSLTLTLDDIEFGVPSAVSTDEQATMEDPSNTRVMVIAKPDRYPIESVEITYDRIDLAEFETLDPPIGILVNTPLTLDTVLAAFNAHYHSALEMADIDPDMDLPEILVEDEPLELKASSSSIGYRGSLILVVTPSQRQLNQLLSNTELSGLVIA